MVLSYPVAKKVAIDLVSCDSVRSAFEVTNKVLTLTEDKSRMKDSVISNYECKMDLYKGQITLYEAKEKSYQNIVTGLNRDLVIQKAKTKAAVIGGVFFMVLSSFISYSFLK